MLYVVLGVESEAVGDAEWCVGVDVRNSIALITPPHPPCRSASVGWHHTNAPHRHNESD